MLVERTPEDMSALIMRGHHIPEMKESHSTFISRNPFGGYQGCALGMAYAALVGDPGKAHFNYYSSVKIGFSPIHFFAREFGISPELALRISNMHCGGNMPAAEIARKISPWTIVQAKANVESSHEFVTESVKLSPWQRFKAWFWRNNRPQLRLVTNP